MPVMRGGDYAQGTPHFRWIYTDDLGVAQGTIDFLDVERTLTLSEEADLLDKTAGTVNTRQYHKGMLDWTCSGEMLYNGTASPFGTADTTNALRAGKFGTLYISLHGTVTGRTRYWGAAIINSFELPIGYDELVMLNLEWQGNGPLNRDTW